MRKPSQRKDFINYLLTNYLLTTQAKNVQLKRLSAYLPNQLNNCSDAIATDRQGSHPPPRIYPLR